MNEADVKRTITSKRSKEKLDGCVILTSVTEYADGSKRTMIQIFTDDPTNLEWIISDVILNENKKYTCIIIDGVKHNE